MKRGGPNLALLAENGEKVAPIESADVDDFQGQAIDSILRAASRLVSIKGRHRSPEIQWLGTGKARKGAKYNRNPSPS